MRALRASAACAAAMFAVLVWPAGTPAFPDEPAAHRADVERNSKHVMPFSMDRTQHVFTPDATGGTQAVLVTNNDPRQIELVRSHLRKESAAFARGDFSDPLAVHGAAMPGLATLRNSRGKLHVRYGDVPRGAELVFESRDAQTIDALHRWFAAQVSDHAGHATMHM
jgi:hypothetical protein